MQVRLLPGVLYIVDLLLKNENYILILSTVPNMETGENIATILVEKSLAACVNIIPNITSIYKWEDRIQKDNELLLFIKTISAKEAQVYDIIRDMHSYETPEIITLNIKNIDRKYADWLNSVVKTTNDKAQN